MIAAAADPAHWDRLLIAPTAPPLTQRELVAAYAEAAGVPAPKVVGTPGWALHGVGLVHRDTRELAEMSYQFTAPFVLDSSATERRLGLSPTPTEVGVERTIAAARAAASNQDGRRLV
jgi:nucleoside-diphosphate-sugar epimerase